MSFFHAECAELWDARSDAVSSHAECAELWEWSPPCADMLRVIKQNEAIQRITSLDCFVVPPRNDAKQREINARQVLRILRFLREIIFA